MLFEVMGGLLGVRRSSPQFALPAVRRTAAGATAAPACPLYYVIPGLGSHAGRWRQLDVD